MASQEELAFMVKPQPSGGDSTLELHDSDGKGADRLIDGSVQAVLPLVRRRLRHRR